VQQSESIIALAPALVAALAEVGGVRKDARNPHFKNDYASLEAVSEATRPILAKHGLGVIQGPGDFDGKALSVTTRILHTSGEWIESVVQIPLSKADAQGAGSAVTYGRRYALMAMLGVAPVDDDGEGAVQRHAQPTPAPVPLGGGRDTGCGEPGGKDWWGCSGPGLPARQAAAQGLNLKFDELRHAFSDVPTTQGWKDLCRENNAAIATMPKAWRTILRAEADLRAEELGISNEKAAA